MRLLLLIISSGLVLQSCKTVTVLKKMNAEHAVYETWTNSENKSVVYVPMVHAGKASFYEDVKRIIAEYKQQGYIVFYEGVQKPSGTINQYNREVSDRYISWCKMYYPNFDSVQKLVELLKIKRMAGIVPDSVSYSMLLKSSPLTKNAVFQPNATSLGLTATDVNVDVSIQQIVDEYERIFGTIILEQIDFAIPLNEPLPGHRRLKKKKSNQVIIDYRNKNLAESIQNSSAPKILIIYGLGHKSGTYETLKKMDGSWKLAKS